MHAGSFDTDKCPDAATVVQVDDHRARIPVHIPDMAIIGSAHDPDERVPRHLLSPSVIPRVRRTTVSEFPKSVRKVDGLAWFRKSLPKTFGKFSRRRRCWSCGKVVLYFSKQRWEKQRSVLLFPSMRQLQRRFRLPITHYKAGIPRILRFVRTVCSVLVDAMIFLYLRLRSPSALAAENLFLRKQLAMYMERKQKPRRATDSARFTLAQLTRFFDWRSALTVVKP